MKIPVPHKTGEPLAPYTTFRIGGPADFLLLPRSTGEFISALQWATGQALPVTVLGGGSNVLVADDGIEGAVILTTGLRQLTITGSQVSAEAGLEMNELCTACAGRGLAGLETFSGLPGTVGGAVYMNARCWERSISETLTAVTFADRNGFIQTWLASRLNFAYKLSRFQLHGEFVLTGHFNLTPETNPENLRHSMAGYRQKRENSGHYQYPNAGCIFKNNHLAGEPSGRLIERCGLKGRTAGAARIFERHANFIINTGQAKAADVLALIRQIEEEVFRQTGIRLEREVQLLGRWQHFPHSLPLFE